MPSSEPGGTATAVEGARPSDPRAGGRTARTWLFVPGDAGPRLDKAEASTADEVVVDLEDAVPADARAGARAAVAAWLASGHAAWVRVNGAGTPWHDDDVAAISGLPGLRGVVVAKAEDPVALTRLRAHLGESLGLLALVETARGIHDVDAVGRSGVDRIAFGTLDFAADVGCVPDHDVLLPVRSWLVTASRVAGLPGPVDGVTPAVEVEAVQADAQHARRLGFTGKLCIHPRQLEAADVALRPTASEVAWARRVVEAAYGGGVVVVDGAMVDAPVVARARRLLS